MEYREASVKSFEKLEILRAAVCVVGIDGEVDSKELALIEKLAKEIGVGQASREAMIDRAKSDPDFCQQMLRVLRTDQNETMLTLFQAAMADGVLLDAEIEVLRHFAEKLQVDSATFENLVAKAKTMLN